MRFPDSYEKLEMFTLSIGVADIRPFYDALVETRVPDAVSGRKKEDETRRKVDGEGRQEDCDGGTKHDGQSRYFRIRECVFGLMRKNGVILLG